MYIVTLYSLDETWHFPLPQGLIDPPLTVALRVAETLDSGRLGFPDRGANKNWFLSEDQ
jgi:hypothetical protein